MQRQDRQALNGEATLSGPLRYPVDRPRVGAGRLVRQSLAAGSFASLVMMPVGLAFKALDLRVGHYGPKLGAALFGELAQPWMQLALLGQHFVIGWLSALPLLLYWQWGSGSAPQLRHGAVYGVAYYLLVNALALPLLFGDPFPMQLGWLVVIPSLVVHLVFGLAIAWLAGACKGRWLWGGPTAVSPASASDPPERAVR